MADQEFFLGYLIARLPGKKQQPYVRTIPTMPSREWRRAAVLVTALGAALGLAIFQSIGGLVGGALVGFAVGMYLVESRRIKQHPGQVPPPAES